MPKETYLHRYSLIIKRLEKSPATFEQIANYLEIETDVQGKNFIISKRTFQRDIKDIYAQLNIEIANEKKGDKRYFIKSKPETEDHSQRLLDAYQMVNLVKVSQEYSAHVLFEPRKLRGVEHFTGLLYAIKNKKIICFDHYKYWEDVIKQRTVHPLALKEARGRWYLIAVDTKDSNLKTFGLDRISELEISKVSFRNKYDFNIEELFTHSFGIINDEDSKPQKITLSFTYEQGQYIKAYPLHHSQKTIGEDENVIVELFIRPTHDFIMELLSFGEEITILSPASLAKKIKATSVNVVKKYT